MICSTPLASGSASRDRFGARKASLPNALMNAQRRTSPYRVLAILSSSLSESLGPGLVQRLGCELDVVHEWEHGTAKLALKSYDAVLAEFHDESPEQVQAILHLR